MLLRIALLVILAGLAVLVAQMLQRRRPDAPTAPSYRAPTQLDPLDFWPNGSSNGPATALVVMFGSTNCDTCPTAWDTVLGALGDRGDVPTIRVDVQTEPQIHKRYRIDGVPTTVVCDPEGTVKKAFFGVVDATVLQQEVGI